MKLWLLSQEQNEGYETYDSCVVCAESEDDAIEIHPSGKGFDERLPWGSWANERSAVKIEMIGEAAPCVGRGVIIASYNAG